MFFCDQTRCRLATSLDDYEALAESIKAGSCHKSEIKRVDSRRAPENRQTI